jgi:hypothetical protein
MRSWIVLHRPSHSLITIIAKSRDRVLAICRTMGWQSDELMIRIK